MWSMSEVGESVERSRFPTREAVWPRFNLRVTTSCGTQLLGAWRRDVRVSHPGIGRQAAPTPLRATNIQLLLPLEHWICWNDEVRWWRGSNLRWQERVFGKSSSRGNIDDKRKDCQVCEERVADPAECFGWIRSSANFPAENLLVTECRVAFRHAIERMGRWEKRMAMWHVKHYPASRRYDAPLLF